MCPHHFMGSSDSQVLEIQLNTETVIQGSAPFCPMTSIMKSKNSTCTIICNESCESGFFISLPIVKNGNRLCGLVTNNHVLPQDQLLNGISFTLIFDANSNQQNVALDNDKFRFTSQLLDFTFVEFLPEELPSEVCFLTVSETTTVKDTFAFITQHPLGGNCVLAQGKVNNIYGFDLDHKISTQPGSSGSPLVDNDGNAIGVHKNINKATDIFYLVAALRNLIENRSTTIEQAIENARSLSSNEKEELKQHGLEETSSPYVFISPRSFGVTSLWFYRTNFGWFWTPEEPESYSISHLQNCNWSFIHPDFEIKAIGGSYDQAKPASRNITLIKWLAQTGLTYNL